MSLVHVNTVQKAIGADTATSTSMQRQLEVALQKLELPILARGRTFHAELTCVTEQLAVQRRKAVTLLECCQFDRLILQLIQLCCTAANTCIS